MFFKILVVKVKSHKSQTVTVERQKIVVENLLD